MEWGPETDGLLSAHLWSTSDACSSESLCAIVLIPFSSLSSWKRRDHNISSGKDTTTRHVHNIYVIAVIADLSRLHYGGSIGLQVLSVLYVWSMFHFETLLLQCRQRQVQLGVVVFGCVKTLVPSAVYLTHTHTHTELGQRQVACLDDRSPQLFCHCRRHCFVLWLPSGTVEDLFFIHMS